MLACFRNVVCVLVTVLVASAWSPAQEMLVSAPGAAPDLSQLTRQAGYIFSGTVLSVAKETPANPSAVGSMRISFRVEQAVRGVENAQVFILNEWTGLWDAGERYRRGERVMLLLYPRSRLGLTSPVGGSQGRFAIDAAGQIILPSVTSVAPQPSPIVTAPPISRKTISAASFVEAIRSAGR